MTDPSSPSRRRTQHATIRPKASLTIEAIGGPTALLEVAGLRLLTDPTFDQPREYVSELFTLKKTTAPARRAEDVGSVDAVLLSHDEHADNLDEEGRRYLATAPLVLSTAGAVERLAGTTVTRPPWESMDLRRPEGTALRVTWVPAQHGPAWATAFTGEVTGFVLSGDGVPTVYVSGDNSSLAVVQQVAQRTGPIDVALLFAGAGVVPPLDATITLTGAEAAEAAGILGAEHIVVIHADGWAHFTEGRTEIEAAFAAVGQLPRLTVLAPGARLSV